MKARPIHVLELRSVRGTGGGPEKTILLGARAADPDRVRVTVCYVRDQRDDVFQLDRRAHDLGIDYVEVRERHSFDLRAWRHVLALVRARGIDVVHAHDYKTDALALAAWWRTGAIPLSTAHGWTGDSVRERRVYYPADKKILARFPRLVAVSSEIGRELVRAGAPPRAVTVILNAIDSGAFVRQPARRDAVRASLGLAPDELVIGAVGRLEAQKRFDILLAAFASLVARYPRLALVVVGDGAFRETLAREADRLEIGTRCRWLGHRTDVADLHHAFDLFVQSSDYEGTPNAVLEAMAMETPIVATDAGGTRELAADGEHALIVPTSDATALAAAMDAALSDPDGARRRATAARQRVETALSFEARTRRLEDLYEELVQQPPRRTPVPAPVEEAHGA